MTALDVDGLRAAAEAATAGPWGFGGAGVGTAYFDGRREQFVAVTDQSAVAGAEWSLASLRTDRANGEFIAAASPDVVLGLLDRLQAAEAAVERVRAVVSADAQWRQACRDGDDCQCSYKDCFECGKEHNCIHTPLAAVRDALDGPVDAVSGEVALGSTDEPGEPQIAYKACSGTAGYPTEEKARDWCRLLNGTGGGFWFYWRCDAGHHHAGGVA